MSSLNGAGLPSGPINQPAFQDPNGSPATDGATSTQSSSPTTTNNTPIAGNQSGLLQNFILPRTTLDALGLLKPSNQGDTEILLSQITLIAEELASDSENALADAGGSVAAAQAAIVAAFRDRIITLQELNRIAQAVVDANAEVIDQLNGEISTAEGELQTLQGQQAALNQQIAALSAIDPITPDIAAQIQQLQGQLDAVNNQIAAKADEISGLIEQRDPLVAENAQLTSEIAVREAEIVNSNALFELVVLLFAVIRAALEGDTDALDDAQDIFAEELSEQNLEEILPNLQEIFEVDIEDAEIQELIDETNISDTELQKALTVSFGLAGSFFEALGLFLQLADLVELDLDTVARANNESQRLQIAL